MEGWNWGNVRDPVLWFILSVLLALLPDKGDAQPPAIRFRHLPQDLGLSQSSIQCITQDRTGFLWFGTEDGLNKYDGYRFTVYRHNPADSFSISDNYIWRLLRSNSGDLWIGTLKGGLNRYEVSTARFIQYRNDPDDSTSLSNDNVTALYEDARGTLWVGTWGGGLCRLDSGSNGFVRYHRDPANTNSLSSNFVSSIKQDAQGNLWIGTWDGLAMLDAGLSNFTSFTSVPGDSTTLCHNMIWDLRIDRHQSLWIATRDGLDCYDLKRKTFRHFRHNAADPRSLSSNNVACLLEDSRGDFWVGTYQGAVCRLDRDAPAWTTFRGGINPAAGPLRNDVLSIAEDRSGTVWFGTSGGISCYDPRADKFFQYSTLQNDAAGFVNIRSIAHSPGGGVWIGMNGGGVRYLDKRFKASKAHRYDSRDAGTLSSDQVLSVLEQRNGTLWVGTLGHGLNSLAPHASRFVRYVHDPANPWSLSENTVIALAEDHHGALWAGTNGGGLNRFDPGHKGFARYRYSNSPGALGGNWIWSLCVDSKGTLWIGTWTRGLYRFDEATDRFEAFISSPADSNSLSNNSVLCITEGTDGYLWLGTHGGGLNRFDPVTKRFHAYTETDGLPNNVVLGILPDEHGNLWVSTNRGMSRFTPSTGEFRNFDVDDGLHSNEFDHGAYGSLADGTMLFGGVSGLSIFHPDSIRNNTVVPPVVLTGFSVFDRPVALSRPIYMTDRIELSYTENFFSFGFVALNYSSSKKNQYMYMLKGLDRDWVKAGTRGVAYYTNVPPGTYVFHVKGSNNDGVWNDMGAQLSVVIEPPFWGTAWFRILVGGAFLAALLTLYRIRMRRWEREKRVQQDFSRQLMQSQENERKRIAGELHDSLVQNLLIVKNRSLLGQQSSHDSQRAAKEFSEITSVITSAINEVRDIAHNLRPYQLDRLGLTRALAALGETMSASSTTAFTTAIENVDALFTADASILVYRVVQEAVNNILRHAHATRASISVRNLVGTVEIVIQDDGRGLPDNHGRGTGFGLSGLEQRVRMMGGILAISSLPEKGTTLTITLPVQT
ncbi:MAG: response regulator receiver protein [Bacteroidetes bacterium]|nr:response regulator receiver protein [Bacteroidota bacterium]